MGRFAARFMIMACLLITPRFGHAQVLYGSLVGNVTDPSGAVVPNAQVKAHNPATGEDRVATADEVGRYSLGNVIPGSYEVEISAPGFQTVKRTQVQTTVNTVTRIDAELQVGTGSSVVNVSGSAAQLQTDKADVHAELGAKEIGNLPLPAYRNFQSLYDLVPGATPTRSQNAITDTPQRSLTTNVNGTARNNNNTRIDGANNVFAWLPHVALYVPPEETIETVNITTSNFDAEQGMAGGAAVVVVTKSGTNNLHGVGYAYWDDRHLQARNVFGASEKPFSLRNIDGGTLGGPIVKNKLFFFGSYEGVWERTGFSGIYTVPTAAMRSGNFSAARTTLYDPATGNADGTNRAVISGGRIDPSRISPIAQRLQSLIPLPNLAGDSANYYNSGVQSLNRHNVDAKIDWNRTNNHHIFGKYSAMNARVGCDFSLGEAGGPGLCSGTGAAQAPTLVQVATLGHSWIFSPNLVFDQVLGFNRIGQNGTDSFFGRNIGTELGIPGTNGPDIRQSGFPIINITGFTSLGQTATYVPFYRNDQTWTTSHNLSWTRGSHELRFGFDLIHFGLNQWQPEAGAFSPRGALTFDGAITALRCPTGSTTCNAPAPNLYNAYAAFLLGLNQSVGKSLQNIKMTASEWQYGWYARDRWQVTRNLTLNLGLRYELYPIVKRSNTDIGRYDLDTNRILIGGVGGNPSNAGVTASHKLFAPRVGLAYRLGDKSVIRLGYGISYDPLPMTRVFRDPYPLTIVQQFQGSSTFTPQGSLATGIPALSVPDLSSGSAVVPLTAIISRSPFQGELNRGYIQSYNFTLERQLPGAVIANVAYVGTATTHQFADHELNAGAPGSGTAGLPLARRFGRTVSTLFEDGWLSSNYNALQVSFNRRFDTGLILKGAYTYSKAINMTDDDGRVGLLFNYDPMVYRNRAVAGYDIPHNFQVGGVYELPFGRSKQFFKTGFGNALLGGWQVNGTLGAYSGVPFTVTASNASLNAPNNTQTADQVSTVTRLGGIGRGQPFYDTSAFRAVPNNQVRFGNSGRNILRGPGTFNANVSVFRTFPIRERFALQFRAESYNVTNTPHFTTPNANVSAGNFMELTTANQDQRQFRLALKMSF